MSATREQYRSGFPWEDWLAVVRENREEWHERYRDATLGELRADYQQVPTPRYVLCLADETGTDSLGTVPYIAKACELAGSAGGVELRILPADRHAGLLDQFRVEGQRIAPICVVFDEAWIQIAHWGPRPAAAQRALERSRRRGPTAGLEHELDDWYGMDRGRSTLAEFLDALRGEPVRPWRAGATTSEHLWRQAEQARDPERPGRSRS